MSWSLLYFFLNCYSYFLSVRFLRNPSRNIHGRDPHFTYHVILTLPLFGGLVGPLMDDNGITWVLYVHNDSIPYKQSAFSLNRPSVPVNSEMSWWPSEMPHCVWDTTFFDGMIIDYDKGWVLNMLTVGRWAAGFYKIRVYRI